MDPTKPGLKTTEFWLMLVGQVVTLLVALGFITMHEGDTISKAVAAAVAAIMAVLGAINYTGNRTVLKQTILNNNQP